MYIRHTTIITRLLLEFPTSLLHIVLNYCWGSDNVIALYKSSKRKTPRNKHFVFKSTSTTVSFTFKTKKFFSSKIITKFTRHHMQFISVSAHRSLFAVWIWHAIVKYIFLVGYKLLNQHIFVGCIDYVPIFNNLL